MKDESYFMILFCRSHWAILSEKIM